MAQIVRESSNYYLIILMNNYLESLSFTHQFKNGQMITFISVMLTDI